MFAVSHTQKTIFSKSTVSYLNFLQFLTFFEQVNIYWVSRFLKFGKNYHSIFFREQRIFKLKSLRIILTYIVTLQKKLFFSFYYLCNLTGVLTLKKAIVVNTAFLFCCGECVRGLFCRSVLIVLE